MVNIAHYNVHGKIIVYSAANGISRIFIEPLSVFEMSKLIGDSALMLELLFQCKLYGIDYLTVRLEELNFLFRKPIFLFSGNDTKSTTVR